MPHSVTIAPARAEINSSHKKRVKIIDGPHVRNEFRHREFLSSRSVERYRCEGYITIDPRDDTPHTLLEQTPMERERTRSSPTSNFLPLPRAPTPYYPRVEEQQQQQQNGRKGVRWTDPLERPPSRNRYPVLRVRPVLKKTDANRKNWKWWRRAR